MDTIKSGFTLVELVIVILIIGILAAVAVPAFVDMTQKAKENKENYTVGAIQMGLHMQELEGAVRQQ